MIIQTNIWICDYCGKVTSETKKVDVYSDPLISLPDDWDIENGNEKCDECIKNKENTAEGQKEIETC